MVCRHQRGSRRLSNACSVVAILETQTLAFSQVSKISSRGVPSWESTERASRSFIW